MGNGAFPLAFTRTYDSRTAFKTYYGGLNQDSTASTGIGWSATYFQSIRYSTGGSRFGGDRGSSRRSAHLFQ